MKFWLLGVLMQLGYTVCAQTGINWSPTMQVGSNMFENQHPRVVTDGDGAPLILWGDAAANLVYFSRWNGTGFTNPVNLNPDVIPVFAASWAGPDIAAYGDTVYVVFKETPEHEGGIYILHSFDGGINFSGPERVDAIADNTSRFPALGTTSDGQPLVAFMKFEPGWTNASYAVAKSKDFGVTFDPDVPASGFSGGDVCDCCPASVTTAGNNVAVVYRDNKNNLRNSWAGISQDGGATFDNGLAIDNTNWMINACPSSGPDGVIIGDSLYAVFMSAASGKSLCYRSRSVLNIQQLPLVEPLTGTISGLSQQNFPRIASAGRAAVVIWTQTVNGNAQLALQFTNNISKGFPAGYELLVPGNVMNADVALTDDGKIYIVWEDMNSGAVGFKSGTYTLTGWEETANPVEAIEIYPNPVGNSRLQLKLPGIRSEQVSYQVQNEMGQTFLSGKVLVTEGEMTLDVSAQTPGIYFLRLEWADRILLRQFLIH